MNTLAETSDLKTAVETWLEDAEDAEEREGMLKDLMYGGCESGMVGELIYYVDTLAFYKAHTAEIANLLRDLMEDTGEDSPADIFGDKWDKTDPLALDTSNRNLLARFAFEETARTLAQEEGIDA